MILVIGKVPPPIGGVSVFTKRHAEVLREELDKDVIIVSPMEFLLGLGKVVKDPDFIYSHSLSLLICILLFCRGKISNSIFIDHNHSTRKKKKSRVYWRIIQFFLSRCHSVNIVSDHLSLNYVRKENLKVISTALMPTKTELSEYEVPSWLKLKIQDKKYVVLSAWRYINEGGKDLYGIDFFVRLSREFPEIPFVICIGDPQYNKKSLEKMVAESDRDGSNTYWWLSCSHAWSLFGANSLYIRATSTDGNSVSIHEANFLGSTVIATDVVPRPDFVKVFKHGSMVECKVLVDAWLNQNN
jgi:hypothetical protein